MNLEQLSDLIIYEDYQNQIKNSDQIVKLSVIPFPQEKKKKITGKRTIGKLKIKREKRRSM